MKPLSLNLKNAKKTASDQHSSTFLLSSGHKIQILHAPISALQRKQISQMPVHKMADGGTAEPTSADKSWTQQDKKDFSQGATSGGPTASEAWANIKANFGMANGGTAEPNPMPSDGDVLDSNGIPVGGSTGLSQGSTHSAVPDDSIGRAPAGGASADWGNNLESGPTVSADAAPQVATKPNAVMPSDLPNVSIADIYNKGNQAIGLGQSAQIGQGQADLKAAQNYQQQILDDQANWETERKSKLADIQGGIDDVNANHIQPKHYLQSMDTGQHIATAIGLILGGAGAHATGGQNMALNFLNDQINRDVEAQKSNQGARMNVLSAYQDKYKDSVVAENMTRATMYGIYANKLQQAADSAVTPQAKANALQAKSQLESNIVPLVNNANLTQMGSKFSGVQGQTGGNEAQYLSYLNAAQRLNPELYKDGQSKYVPGVGVATHPVAKEDADRIGDLNSLEPLVDKAIADQTNYGDLGAWSPKNRADALSDRTSIQVQLNKLTGLKRLNDQEYQNYGQQIGNIGGINMGGTLESLKNLKKQIQTDRSTGMSHMGVVPFMGAKLPSGLSPQQQMNLDTYMKKNPSLSKEDAMSRLKQNGYL